MACLVGANVLHGTTASDQNTSVVADCGRATCNVPAPSPSYAMVDRLEKASNRPNTIPPAMHDELARLKKDILDKQAESRMPKRSAYGPAPPTTLSTPFNITISETANGHKVPKVGDKVRIGYVVADGDGNVVDMRPEFDHVVGDACFGGICGNALEAALCQMRRGQVASLTCPLHDLFVDTQRFVSSFDLNLQATCEIKLFDIFSSKDCSFEKDAGVVLKSVMKEGSGAWCDTTTDEGFVELKIESVWEGRPPTDNLKSNVPIIADNFFSPQVVKATTGNGVLCDALEAAVLEMKQHETSVVTCSDVNLCIGGAPHLTIEQIGNWSTVCFRVTLMDYTKGPDPLQFDEVNKAKFAARRKQQGDKLIKQCRCELASERYRRILELFKTLDLPESTNRFLGQWDLYQENRRLKIACRLNLALCRLKVGDARGTSDQCDAVLVSQPENTKALFRRAKAHSLRQDYTSAIADLERLLEIDNTVKEAHEILRNAKLSQAAFDRKQQRTMKFNRMVAGINDLRSIKHDYMDVPDSDEEDESCQLIEPESDSAA